MKNNDDHNVWVDTLFDYAMLVLAGILFGFIFAAAI